MSKERINYLFSRYFGEGCTLEERHELIGLLRIEDASAEEEIKNAMELAWADLREKKVFSRFQRDKMIESILEESPSRRVTGRVHFLKTIWFRYAAAVLLIAGAAAYFGLLNSTQKSIPSTATPASISDIAPGGNKALLTLADGRVITLDTAENGSLAQQGMIDIIKLSDGRLAYKGGPEGVLGEKTAGQGNSNMLNTITTPRRGQYQIVLSDGSKVWLNAESSISFPPVFAGKERVVTVTGEVYIEVAPDSRKPFFALARQARVEVLGTSFNMNAYPDETVIRTTLIEGSISVSVPSGDKNGAQTVRLKPGWEAVISNDAGSGKNDIKAQACDAGQAVAWKEGIFDFKNVPLTTAMGQIARWYDVEIVYPPTMPAIEIWGKVQRNLTLQQLIKVLKGMEIQCVLDGRKLILQS